MSKSVLRIVLTILMYAGVAVFLFPYATGRITEGIPFMLLGAGCTVVCGLLRCYLTEGDCARIPHHGRDGNGIAGQRTVRQIRLAAVNICLNV